LLILSLSDHSHTGLYPDHCVDRHHRHSRKLYRVYPAAYRNNLLFVGFNTGRMRRNVLSGADLTLLDSSSTAYNGGQGDLLSLMLGTDGYVSVSSASAIFKVVPQ
jgi:hypothetical protein